jgi:hypothetical protein
VDLERSSGPQVKSSDLKQCRTSREVADLKRVSGPQAKFWTSSDVQTSSISGPQGSPDLKHLGTSSEVADLERSTTLKHF